MGGEFTFKSFERQLNFTMQSFCRELYRNYPEVIQVRKEEVAVKNLVTIITAALKLCNRKGFAAMSLRDLHRETGLSMGALYSYFRSKEELLNLIQRQGSKTALDVLSGAVVGIDHPLDQFRRMVRTHIYLSEIMQAWFYFSYTEAKNFPPAEQRKAVESELYTEKLIVDIVDHGISHGIFKHVNSELFGASVKALLQDWYLKRRKYAKRKISVEEYADFVLEFLESYLTAGACGENKKH